MTRDDIISALKQVMDALHLWHWTGETAQLESAHDTLRDIIEQMEKQEPEEYMPLFADWAVFGGKCPPCNQDCNQGRDCPQRKNA